MQLLLQRTQERTMFGSREYVLHVTLICTAEEFELVVDHGLSETQLFAVPEVENHQQQADRAFQRSDVWSPFNAKEARQLLSDSLSGLTHTMRAKLAFVLTVADAIDGTSISCPNLRELVDCEREITDAFDDLNEDVQDALHFATDREQVFTPDDTDQPDGPPPATWADHAWTRTR